MRTRKLGSTDLELTAIGLGTWAIGGPWEYGWGPQDDKDSIAAIMRALDMGINWIDTAAAYGCGHAEEVIAKALRKIHQKPLIATKCGVLWDDNRRKINCLDSQSIRNEIDNSLRRLKVEVIDLYQVHWPQPEEKIEKAWEQIAKALEAGKIRCAGVCNFNVTQLKRIQPIHPVVSLQPPYSLLHRDAENELLGYCAQNNIGVICYSPMQKGLLTGKFSAERVANLPRDDHRRRDSNFLSPRLEIHLELVGALRKLAKKDDRTVAQLAIAWVLRRPEVTAAIVGARKPHQIEETALAAGWNLSQDDLREIDHLLEEHDRKINESNP